MRTQIDDELKRRGLRLGASPTVANLNTLIGMLDAGMGVTLMPRSTATRSSAAEHSIVELEDIELLRKFAWDVDRKRSTMRVPWSRQPAIFTIWPRCADL